MHARVNPGWMAVAGLRLLCSVVLLAAGSVSAQALFKIYRDPAYDVLPRPTGRLGTTPFDLDSHRPPNLINMRIGRWQSTQGPDDLFVGVLSSNGAFLRIDLSLAGLANPPGSTDPLMFDPFRYGPHPVYGFIEIDVDNDNETGGEVDAPQFRYLANAARFGGLPESNAFDDRLARRGSDLDDDFTTPPFIERHGEEFHWALLGGQFLDSSINEKSGNGDLIFDPGEDWRIVGDWFHRAHGFERYSLAFGGVVPGEYLPYSIARFTHDEANDITTVTLLVPMTNAGAAIAVGRPAEQAEPHDSDTSNDTSIAEALEDLTLSASLIVTFPTGESEEALITGWHQRHWSEFLNPREWRLTALLGTSYTAPGAFFIWSDIFPNVERGNTDGAAGADSQDRLAIERFINDFDTTDGVVDSAIELAFFAEDFDVMDINYDGVVDARDVLGVSQPGDLDSDGDIDMWDLVIWQRCQGPISNLSGCALSDINGDRQSNFADLNWALSTFSGPP